MGWGRHACVCLPTVADYRSICGGFEGVKGDCGDEWNFVFVNGGLLTEEVIGIKSDSLQVKDSSAEFLCGVGS